MHRNKDNFIKNRHTEIITILLRIKPYDDNGHVSYELRFTAH